MTFIDDFDNMTALVRLKYPRQVDFVRSLATPAFEGGLVFDVSEAFEEATGEEQAVVFIEWHEMPRADMPSVEIDFYSGEVKWHTCNPEDPTRDDFLEFDVFDEEGWKHVCGKLAGLVG